MALAFDATANAGAFVNRGSFTWTHTCTGSNLILIVGIVKNDTGARSTVTYNSISMNFLAEVIGSGTGFRVEMFYLAAPSTGANTVSASMGGGGFCTGGSISFTGAKQSSIPNASGTQDATGNPSKAVTSTDNNCMYVDVVGMTFQTPGNNFSSPTPGNQEVNIHTDLLGFGNAMAMQYYLSSGQGANTLGWTQSPSGDEHGYVVAALSPVFLSQVLKVNGVAQASVNKVFTVANASAHKIEGVQNTA